jgi:transglycosylase-like protein with SLT domain/CHAP domain-containing protein
MNKKSGMMSGLGLQSLLIIAFACFFVLFCAIGAFAVAEQTAIQAVTAETGGGSSVVIEALNIASHLVKPSLDAFDSSDMSPLPIPGLNPKYSTPDAYLTELYTYLRDSHQSGEPANNVQCVAFVRAAYHMAGFPLPTDHGGINFAKDYWGGAASWPGWNRIPNGQALPAPGDIVVLDHPGAPGHVSIVVSVMPPKQGQSTGSVLVAEGNAGYTTLTTQNDPRIPGINVPAGIPLSVLPYDPSTNVVDSTWGRNGYSIIGFLHNTKLDFTGGVALPVVGPQCMQMPAGMPSSPYVQVAWADAIKYGICPRYFVNQIRQESHFDPNSVSDAGAVGIAQFMAGTAPTWGLKVGGGVDERRDPIKSLDAAARMMSASYKNYLKSNPPTVAYMKALAAYNAGSGSIGSSGDWFSHLSSQPYNYVIIIMELNIPKK